MTRSAVRPMTSALQAFRFLTGHTQACAPLGLGFRTSALRASGPLTASYSLRGSERRCGVVRGLTPTAT